MPQHDTHLFYRAILRLYPKAHRREYGEQMVQTLDDMLSERQGASDRLGVWLRIVLELPQSLLEEHVNNMKEMGMSSKVTNKKVIISVGVAGIIVAGAVLLFVITRPDQFTPTTLSKVPRSASSPACVQLSDDPKLAVKADDKNFIVNAAITSIIDVPAGTNVDVHLKSYESVTASGTAVYSGKYGTYNFMAKKTTANTSNSYVGGWQITHFEACKS